MQILPALPQPLFERLLAWVIQCADPTAKVPALWKDESDDWDDDRDCSEVLLSLPIGQSRSLEELDLLASNHVIAKWVEDNSLDGYQLPFIPITAVACLLWAVTDWNPDVTDLAPRVARQLRAILRQPDFEDALPWSAAESASIGSWFTSYAREPAPAWQLRIAFDESLECADGPTSPFAAFPPEARLDRQLRLKSGLEVASQIADEGWEELACAYLAFLLATQTAIHDGPLECGLVELKACLNRLRHTPGHHYVESAMALVVGRSEGARYIELASWYPNTPRGTDEGHSPYVSTKSIQTDIYEKLGREYYLRLPAKAKTQLVGAEELWFHLHRHVGTGRGDFGALMTSYTKVVEIILREKLAPVFSSDAYLQSEGKTAKLALNEMLHPFHHYETRPLELQQLIRSSGIRLQEDPTLIKVLRNLGFKRNEGAHTADLSDTEVIHIRQVYFENGSLRRLLDLLP